MRCWLCGVEPLETYDVTTFSDPQRRYIPGRWPPGDHDHAAEPPTPGQLEQAGHEALTRILGAAS